MSSRLWFVVVLGGSLLAASATGCMGSHRVGKAGTAAGAPAADDVAHHPNPNAPYILAGGTPHLVHRATALEAANAGPCDPEVLSVEEIAGDTNGNFRSVKLAFMNRGAVPCRLGGYPQVALLSATGEPIGNVTTQKTTTAQVMAEFSKTTQAAAVESAAPQVTLMPHEVAAFQVVWTTGADCATAAQILVRAPGMERAFTIPQPVRICTGRVQVTELRLDDGAI